MATRGVEGVPYGGRGVAGNGRGGGEGVRANRASRQTYD